MFFVYILYSEKGDRFYIGQTNDLNERISRHNSGYEKSTKPYAPWAIKWSTMKQTRSEAMKLERKLKNLSKQRILDFIKKYTDGMEDV